jgi:hypothetical protein
VKHSRNRSLEAPCSEVINVVVARFQLVPTRMDCYRKSLSIKAYKKALFINILNLWCPGPFTKRKKLYQKDHSYILKTHFHFSKISLLFFTSTLWIIAFWTYVAEKAITIWKTIHSSWCKHRKWLITQK